MSKLSKNPSGGRFEGLDLARFLAFAGMVVVNFKIAMGVAPGTSILDGMTSALEGRAAATFVVLAGVGLGLAGRKGTAQVLPVTLRRSLFLLVIGLFNMTIFEADILHYYAFYFLFGALMLGWSSGALIAGIITLNLAFIVMILTLTYDAGWNWDDYSYDGFWTPAGFIRNLIFNGWHPVIPWLGFLLFGIILSRVDLAASRVQVRLLIGGTLLLALAQGVSALLLPWAKSVDPELGALFTTSPIPPMPLYTLAGMGAACFVIGASLLAAGPLDRVGILAWLVPAGRQTLTLYIAHILIGMGTLEALDMLGGQTIGMAVFAASLFGALAVVYAATWARWFTRGPVEALMRRVAG